MANMMRELLSIADDVYRAYMRVATCEIPTVENANAPVYRTMREALREIVRVACVFDDLSDEVMRRIDETNETVSAVYPSAVAEFIGKEHGRGAASWFEIASEDDARRILDADDAGELDAPNSPLSGEWADSYSEADLRRDCGLSDDDDASWQLDNIANVYNDAYVDAWHDAVVSRATAYLS